MEFATIRRLVGAAVVAVAGLATGAVVVQAEPVARAAAGSGGVSLRPQTVEHVASKGRVGRITVKNTTNGTLRMWINVRPWLQNRFTGNVVPNYRANLSPYVRASAHSFRLGAASRGEAAAIARDAGLGGGPLHAVA